MYRTIRNGKFNPPDESPSQRAEATADGFDCESAEVFDQFPPRAAVSATRTAADTRLDGLEQSADSEAGSVSTESCAEKPGSERKPPTGGRLSFE